MELAQRQQMKKNLEIPKAARPSVQGMKLGKENNPFVVLNDPNISSFAGKIGIILEEIDLEVEVDNNVQSNTLDSDAISSVAKPLSLSSNFNVFDRGSDASFIDLDQKSCAEKCSASPHTPVTPHSSLMGGEGGEWIVTLLGLRLAKLDGASTLGKI
jgi:hypothetical protein